MNVFGLDVKSLVVGAVLGYVFMNFLLPMLGRKGE